MQQPRTIQHLVRLVALTLLALVACAPSAQPTPERVGNTATPSAEAAAANMVPTPATTPVAVALPTADLSRLLTNASTSENPIGFKTWALDGISAELGPEADEVLRLADELETAAVQDILLQMRAGSKPKGMPAPLPPVARFMPEAPRLPAFEDVFTLLSGVPDLVKRPGEGESDSSPITKETHLSPADNLQAHVKTETRVAGCHAEIDVEMTVRAKTENVAYDDKATGKISMPICPDAEGRVPIDVSITGSLDANDIRIKLDLKDHAVAHVDEEGNLTSIDQNLETELDAPTGKNWFTGKFTNSSVRVTEQATWGGLSSGDATSQTPVVTGGTALYTSFPPNQEILIRAGVAVPTLLWQIVEEPALRKAEAKWKDGFCVAIQVAEGNSRQVQVGSETPFTASVRHQFEGTELSVPVIATLTNGTGSVIPSGTKVPAPATFRYKAPDQAGQEATVELVSRSRRGIGKLTIGFNIDGWFYTVDGLLAPSESHVRLTGNVCALDQPFMLQAGGHNPSGGRYEGKFKFTPAGASGGRWTHTGTSCVAPLGCGAVTANGTYQWEGSGSSQPVLVLQALIGTARLAGGSGTWENGPRWPLELKPTSMYACYTE